MTILRIMTSLRGYYDDGKNVTSEAFVAPLRISDERMEALADRGAWKSALITLSRRTIKDYEDCDEPHDAFAADVTSDLQRAAQWLQERRIEIETLKGRGMRLDVFVDLWIDQEQMELSLPPSLLGVCGDLGLKLEMITND